ncbi:MAG: ankyrin repeat domain-containing protein [Rubrivivax sp.]|nr:ankyrin repeat domain-containing protein [Rubrivivax sp.]
MSFAAAAAPPPATIGEACMKVELPALLQRLGSDPRLRTREDAEARALGYCRMVVRSCGDAPAADACRRALEGYGLGDGKPVPVEGAQLFAAANAGRNDDVRRWLAAGASVDWRNLGGWTPLMIAAAERHADTVAVLLEAGADPNLRNQLGRSALMFAAGYGQLAIVERLLAARADPNLVPDDGVGVTALMAAAAGGHAQVVQALLRAGARPGTRTSDGRTALDMARAGGHGEIAQLLQAAAEGR